VILSIDHADRLYLRYLRMVQEGRSMRDILIEVWDDGRRYVPTSEIPAAIAKKQRMRNAKETWLKLRYRALQAANGKCQCCGATPESSGHPLHVDHIKPKAVFPELALEFSNLQVLCKDCNFGKHQWDETDWRKVLPSEAV
jgi:5-methylcytosine-specific restriction endonuclease McrA